MSDIELVIKIPNNYDLSKIKNGSIASKIILDAVKNGTPLPKGHGDLIDRNEIEYMKAIHDLVWGKITSSECATKIIHSAPTIIEADKEKEEWVNG